MNDNTYPIEVVDVDTIPERLRIRGVISRGAGKWEWLRKLIVQTMVPEAKKSGACIKRLRFPNRKMMQMAQAACSGCSYKKNIESKPGEHYVYTHIKDPGYSITTRSEPINGRDGEYFLYVQVSYSL